MKSVSTGLGNVLPVIANFILLSSLEDTCTWSLIEAVSGMSSMWISMATGLTSRSVRTSRNIAKDQ